MPRPVLDVVALAAVGGAVLAGTAVTPLVVANGPPEALLVYPELAALPGGAVGAVVGLVVALVSARRSGAAGAAGTTSPGSSRAPGR